MDVNVTIIGAGAIGLAVAFELGQSHQSILVVEKEPTFGRGVSSRNSEVIHAGIYYEPGSRMAQLCVEGKARLYRFCNNYGIGYRRLGKIIVATTSEETRYLESLFIRGETNGVDDLKLISGQQVAALEPNIRALGGLLSPSTGIIDSLALMNYLYTCAGGNGVNFAFATDIIGLEWRPDGIDVVTQTADGETFTYRSKIVINCAGLNSDHIAGLVGLNIDQADYRLFFCKGDYFSIRPTSKTLVSRLIYPVKTFQSTGLGVHITIDLNGRLRLGPDAVYIQKDEESYTVNPCKRDRFAAAAQRYLPSLAADDLSPAMSGIRPTRTPQGQPQRDFVIRHEADRGYFGLINLVGIESPGLTSALAIGVYVRRLIEHDQLLG